MIAPRAPCTLVRVSPSDWPLGSTAPTLAAGEVHVWRLDISLERDAALLSTDERERAARFHFARDRDRFVSGRAALRELLGRYLGAAPASIAFDYGPRGKPHVRGLHFNLSHSDDAALLAVGPAPLGVDIERCEASPDLASMAARCYGALELQGWRASADPVGLFFTLWTRKEAFIKATGEGVSQLADFDVSLRPGEPAQLLRVAGEARPAGWSMCELPTIPGYAAALVVAGASPRLACYAWPPGG